MKKTFMFLLLALPFLVQAQFKFSGQIADENNGMPIVGAWIQVSGLESYQALSDNRGAFVFKQLPEGHYTINVKFVGYQTYKESFVLQKDQHVSIDLREGILAEEVVVNANRLSERSPAAFKNIHASDIEKLNTGRDLPFILSLTPSFVSTSDAGNGIGYTSFRIRGSDLTRTNVTMNGVPVNDAESHSVYFVDLPDLASSLDNVQVQRGIGSSTNGAGAFGASINLQTDLLSTEAYAKYSGSFGSFNSLKNTIGAGTGLLDNNMSFDVRLSKITSDGYIDRATANLKSLYFSGGYYGEKDIVKFILLSGKERTYQAWDGVPKYMLDTNRTYNKFTYEDQVDDYQQDYYQLHYTHLFNDNLSVNASAFYTKGKGYYEQFKNKKKLKDYGFNDIIIGGDTLLNDVIVGNDTIDHVITPLDTISKIDLIQRKWLDNHFYGVNVNLNYESRKLNAVLGGGWNQYDGDHYGRIIWAQYPAKITKGYEWYNNNGLKTDYNVFAKANYMFTNSLSAYADVQYRHIQYDIEGNHDDLHDLTQSHTFNFVNPKVGVVYHLGNLAKVYASYAIANREPSRNNYKDADDNYEPKPEKMQDIEAGFRINTNKFAFSTNFYYMNYKDQLVSTGKINGIGEPIMTNVDKSYRMGVEISLGTKITKQLDWDFNIALSKNKIKNFVSYTDNWDTWSQIAEELGTTNILLSPSTVANSIFTFRPFKHFSASWIAQYVSRQYIDNTSYKYNSLDPYFVNNLHFTYAVHTKYTKSLKLFFNINNIFAEKYCTNAWVYNYYEGGERKVIDGYFPMALRNFMMGVSISL